MADAVYPDSVEPAFYPNTATFVNLLGITNLKKLKVKEADFTAIRSIELLHKTDLIPQTFDFSHLKAIHRYLFQDLYAWAGKPRSYDMKKGGDQFTPAKQLPKYESEVFSRSIKLSHCSERPSISTTAISLASCLGIINVYHPFPEGNGRTQRIFISLLSNMFRYSLDWSNAHPWEIVETAKKVHERNYKPLEALIQRIIRDENKL